MEMIQNCTKENVFAKYYGPEEFQKKPAFLETSIKTKKKRPAWKERKVFFL